MKWLFFVLVSANLLFFGYTHLVPPAETVTHIPKEINASQVRIVNASTIAAASTPISTPAPVSASTTATSPLPPASATTMAVQAQATSALCLRWTGITGDQTQLARDKLRQLGLNAQENTAAQNAKFWVYVPPLADIETAKKKAQQFATLGVDDYFVVNNGSKWQNAISLGIFSTQEAGERRLAELRDKGVKSAIVRERDDGVRHSSFLIRPANAEQQAKLVKLSELLRGSQVETTDCN